MFMKLKIFKSKMNISAWKKKTNPWLWSEISISISQKLIKQVSRISTIVQQNWVIQSTMWPDWQPRDPRTLPPTRAVWTFFSSKQEIRTKKDHFLVCKTNFNIFKRIQVTMVFVLWPHLNWIRKQKNKKSLWKIPNIWKINITPINKPWVKEEIKWETKSILKQMKRKENNIICENLPKAVVRVKFILLNMYIKEKITKMEHILCLKTSISIFI